MLESRGGSCHPDPVTWSPAHTCTPYTPIEENARVGYLEHTHFHKWLQLTFVFMSRNRTGGTVQAKALSRSEVQRSSDVDPGVSVPTPSPTACVQPPHGHALGRLSQLPGFAFVDVTLRSLAQNTLGSTLQIPCFRSLYSFYFCILG